MKKRSKKWNSWARVGIPSLVLLGGLIAFSLANAVSSPFTNYDGWYENTHGHSYEGGFIHPGAGEQYITRQNYLALGGIKGVHSIFDARNVEDRPSFFQTSYKSADNENDRAFLSAIRNFFVLDGNVFVGIPLSQFNRQMTQGGDGFAYKTYNDVYASGGTLTPPPPAPGDPLKKKITYVWTSSFGDPLVGNTFSATFQKVNVQGEVKSSTISHRDISEPQRVCVTNEGILTLANCPVGTHDDEVGSGPYQCTGSVPANAVLCPDDNTGLTQDTAITLVENCSDTQKCEYHCASGYHYENGSCVANQCTGTVPSHATLCSGDDTGLAQNMPITLVDTCTTQQKCEAFCDIGYHVENGQCVQDAQYEWQVGDWGDCTITGTCVGTYKETVPTGEYECAVSPDWLYSFGGESASDYCERTYNENQCDSLEAHYYQIDGNGNIIPRNEKLCSWNTYSDACTLEGKKSSVARAIDPCKKEAGFLNISSETECENLFSQTLPSEIADNDIFQGACSWQERVNYEIHSCDGFGASECASHSGCSWLEERNAIQERDVYCVDTTTNTVVSDDHCIASEKPEGTKVCAEKVGEPSYCVDSDHSKGRITVWKIHGNNGDQMNYEAYVSNTTTNGGGGASISIDTNGDGSYDASDKLIGPTDDNSTTVHETDTGSFQFRNDFVNIKLRACGGVALNPSDVVDADARIWLSNGLYLSEQGDGDQYSSS